jgi:hypothetical protein
LTPLTDRVFLKRESSTIYWHQCRFWPHQQFFCLHIYSLWTIDQHILEYDLFWRSKILWHSSL